MAKTRWKINDLRRVSWWLLIRWQSSRPHLIGWHHNWANPIMKPFSDYCCTPDEWSPDYAAYVKQRGYHLHSVANYGKLWFWPRMTFKWPRKWPRLNLTTYQFLILNGLQAVKWPHLTSFDLRWPFFYNF